MPGRAAEELRPGTTFDYMHAHTPMNPIPHDQLLGQLRWRYATKQFDPAKKIPAEVWAALEESLVLTPSSCGLQPWKFLVIQDPALREQLKAVSWGQGQVTDASHLVVFAVKRENTPEDIGAYMACIAEARNQPIDHPSISGFKKMVIETSNARPNLEWNARQAYIALGNFMTSAALLGVDTCPLEGLDPVKYDEILGLEAQNLATQVACVAGYRADTDKYASLPKVRFKKERVVEYR
jgi:nitroreductase